MLSFKHNNDAVAGRPLQPGRVWLVGLSLLTLLGTWSPVIELFGYDMTAVHQGQLWRPLTAWWTQLNLQHWLLNQWGLIVLWLLWPVRLSWACLLGYGVVWWVSSLMLALSDYDSYVGLSGLLYGWLVIAAIHTPFYPPWVRATFLALLSGKVMAENFVPGLSSTDWVGELISARVAHESHLWGLLSGWGVIGVGWLVPRVRSGPECRG